jgi:hypothetical protein
MPIPVFSTNCVSIDSMASVELLDDKLEAIEEVAEEV